MPRRFSAEELAASAALGELKTEASFEGDIDAWRGYQHFVVVQLTGVPLPPVGDASRASRWKAVRRQRGQIEEQRRRDAEAEPARAESKLLNRTSQLLSHATKLLCPSRAESL